MIKNIRNMGKQKKEKNHSKGITLIVLVITIIVLLILAGVTIAALTGDNGILTNAIKAREKTEIANVIEQAKTDVLGIQAENKANNIKKGELKTVLDKYFKNVPDDYTRDTVLTLKDEYGSYQISVSDIYNGNLDETQEVISKTHPYVGYYADIDSNGTVDGIIYADLIVGRSGAWGNIYYEWSEYEYSAVTTELKDYYISQTGYKGIFGTKDVLSPTGTGNDRFYVMALSDIDANKLYWYYSAYENMSDYDTATSEKFGTGKANTQTIIGKWNDEEYGMQNANDIWGLIQSQVDNGWFVPSRGEWSAFAGKLGITSLNYTDLELNGYYWSSSQQSTSTAYNVRWDSDFIANFYVTEEIYVRLSTTF